MCGGVKPAGFLAPLAIFAVPLGDTAYVSVLRARAGRPFWHGSPDHFPLRLRRRLGGRVRATVVWCYVIAGTGSVIGVGSALLWSWEVALGLIGAYLLAFLVLLAVLARVPMEESA